MMPCLTPALATVKTTRGEAAVSGKAEAPALPGHLEQPRVQGECHGPQNGTGKRPKGWEGLPGKHTNEKGGRKGHRS